MTKRAKPRKPRAFYAFHQDAAPTASIPYSWAAETTYRVLSPRQCRRLAAWLLKAADFLEAKEGGGTE